MANLKFYKGTETYINGLASTPVEGAIWFNTTNHTIQVRTASGWEVYTGLVDASYDESKKIFTITKHDGSKTELNFSDCASAAALSALTTKVSGIESTVTTHGTDITNLKTEAKANTDKLAGLTETTVMAEIAKQVKAEETRATGVEGGLNTRIGSLETDNTANKSAIKALQEAVGEGGSVDTKIADAIEALGGEATGDGAHVDVKVVTENGEVKSVTVTESDIASAQALADEASTARAAEKANADAIATEKGRINTLVGSDANMSARAIVQDEVAKQLESDNISDSFDTLKEMAEYLSSHPQDVTDMNSAINTNTTNIGLNTAAIEAIQAAYVKSVTDSAEYLEITTSEGVVTVADTTLKNKIDELAGLIADNADAIEEVAGQAGVTMFGGQTGAITVDTDTTTNGQVKFAVTNKKLTGSVVGIQDAAYTTVASLNSTAQGYATAAQEAAATDATTKANAAQSAAVTSANSYTDTKVSEALTWAEFQ